jgi:hypothetical protein
MMLVLNIGSKYITLEFSDSQEQYIRNSLGREILIFAICFIATKDIFITLILTAVFVVLADHLFNETSSYCMLPESFKKLKSAIDTDGDGVIDEKELNNALKLLNKAKVHKKRAEQKKTFETFSYMSS